jgi:hypothetical protein
MMTFRKTPDEKEQKQQEMIMLETKYEQFLADKIAEKRNFLQTKYPEIKTLFEGWIYGVYIAVLDVQQIQERKGKLFYLFENITESTNKYKLAYTIDDKNNCVFNPSILKSFPKSYLSIVKRHHFNTTKEKSTVSELITAHLYKLDDSAYIHHSDNNKLNNNIKNLVPMEKTFFDSLSDDEQKNIAKPHQHIPEKYKAKLIKKPKGVVIIEYRACDLYYNHRIPPEKIAATLRNKLNKAAIERIVRLYPYFKIYSAEQKDK